MPSSNLLCAPEVLMLVQQCDPHRTVLDVGPGRGKYGLLLREYVDGVERVDAVEAWPAYVTDRLRCVYDEVHTLDVLAPASEWFERFDVVLMCDVIEHLEMGPALALLDRIPGHVVICTPRDWFQNPEADDVPPERHRSHWRVEDFEAIARTRVAYVNEWGAVLAALLPK